MIFHYHYQWNKQDERKRNIAAMHEHLTYIDALQRRDASAVTQSCSAHMATARLTLLASIQGARDATDAGRPWPFPGRLAGGEPSQARSRH